MNRIGVHSSICAMVLMIPAIFIATSPYVTAQEEEELPTEVVMQETRTSTQDPLPGHETHQAVLSSFLLGLTD